MENYCKSFLDQLCEVFGNGKRFIRIELDLNDTSILLGYAPVSDEFGVVSRVMRPTLDMGWAEDASVPHGPCWPFQIGSVDVGWLPLRPGDCAVPYVVCQVCDHPNESREYRDWLQRGVLPKVLGYAAAPRDFSDSHGAHKRSSVVHLNPLIPAVRHIVLRRSRRRHFDW